MVPEAGNTRRYRAGTAAVHGGLGKRDQGAPFLAGPTFAGPFHLQGDDLEVPGKDGKVADVYGRYDNPSWRNLELALSGLEGENVHTLVFPSGSAAIAAVMMTTLKARETVIVPSDGYPAARFVGGSLSSLGIKVQKVPTDTSKVIAALPKAALVLLESPSNPGLDLIDIEAIAAVANDVDTRLVVDNTVATPLGQRPLDLGAAGSVMSGSKYLTGHNDLILGSFTTADEKWSEQIKRWRTKWGVIVGPFEAWLAHRSLATLEVRLQRQCESALALAKLLSERSGVVKVRYPGLSGDPAHVLARKQMRNFGTIICFDLGSADRANRFLSACNLIIEATSFGGVHSCAERRKRWEIDDDISEGLIRLSVGIEDLEDLREDLEQALDSTPG